MSVRHAFSNAPFARLSRSPPRSRDRPSVTHSEGIRTLPWGDREATAEPQGRALDEQVPRHVKRPPAPGPPPRLAFFFRSMPRHRSLAFHLHTPP